MAPENLFLGSNVVQLVYVEVTPLTFASSQHVHLTSSVTCSTTKHVLQRLSLESSLASDKSKKTLVLEWARNDPVLYDVGKGAKTAARGNSIHHTSTIEQGYLKVQKASDERPHAGISEFAILSTTQKQDLIVPIMYLPSEDPTEFNALPCCVKAYGRRTNRSKLISQSEVAITDSTLVHVLPVHLARSYRPSHLQDDCGVGISESGSHARVHFLQALTGEIAAEVSQELNEDVLKNHNPETVTMLTQRMSRLLSEPILIGSTYDAFSKRRVRQTRRGLIRGMIDEFYEVPAVHASHFVGEERHMSFSLAETRHHMDPLKWEPSIIVHSPNNADGKTLLVQAIAASQLKPYNPTVHLIRGSALVARFGIQSDVAIESIVHRIIFNAAVSDRGQRSVCIILDQLDAMLPPHFSGRASAGDAGVPVMNAIASYLKNMTRSLHRARELPFPRKNRLYNISAHNGTVLPARLCLVGIVTCPDDGWRTSHGGSGGSSCIFDCLIGGRHRVESLNATTRLSALQHALQTHHIQLVELDKSRLPVIAASATWIQGKSFGRIARTLSDLIADRSSHNKVATSHDVERAIAIVRLLEVQSRETVSFEHASTRKDRLIASRNNEPSVMEDLFGMVGGNAVAKQSLEDALAIDPRKRRMLARFGLSPSAGILLYGPPGTGKTLMAKAVANLLRADARCQGNPEDGGHMALGGAFVSLAASDIVRAEVGVSEKMVASAFEEARKNAPSVIFIDEFQSLFTDRDKEGSGRLASTLLQAMDDIKRWRDIGSNEFLHESVVGDGGAGGSGVNMVNERNHLVVLIGATNIPWRIDKAFYRPGRFDRVVHVGLPSTPERQSILLIHMKRMRIQHRDDLDVLSSWIANRSVGFSGADLAALCRAAAIRCLNDTQGNGEITQRHFENALKHDIGPSSSQDLVERLQHWRPER